MVFLGESLNGIVNWFWNATPRRLWVTCWEYTTLLPLTRLFFCHYAMHFLFPVRIDRMSLQRMSLIFRCAVRFSFFSHKFRAQVQLPKISRGQQQAARWSCLHFLCSIPGLWDVYWSLSPPAGESCATTRIKLTAGTGTVFREFWAGTGAHSSHVYYGVTLSQQCYLSAHHSVWTRLSSQRQYVHMHIDFDEYVSSELNARTWV